MEVHNCINKYYKSFPANTQEQHNFIYNFMIPTLQTVLSEVKDSLVTTQENTEIQSYELKYPLPTSPASPFNWNEFIESLSLTGLQNCALATRSII